MNKKTVLIIALIVLASSAISFSMLTRGHVWWDDFAAYILQAKSILSGTMDEFIQRNAFTIENSSYPPGPVAYPWGFPLLLAPLLAIFSLNALAFKLVNTLFYMLFLVVFFALARARLTEVESLLLTSALAFNPALLQGHDLILADIPFLFFSTLGIVLIDRFIRQKTLPLAGITIGAVIFAANFMRTNGILLLAPLALTQLIQLWPQREDKVRRLAWLKSALVPYLTVGLLFALQSMIFPNGQGAYFSHFSMFTPQGLLDNVRFYLLELPSWAFRELPGGNIFYVFIVIFYLLNLVTHLRRDVAIHAYTALTLAIFITWPERQGLRFIYPVLPFLFVFAFDGMKLATAQLKTGWQKSANLVLNGFWMTLAVVSLGISFTFARDNLAANRAINGPFDPVSAEMFEFVREEIPANSVIIFFKPRAMRLFTDRDSFMTERCEDLTKGDYMAMSEKVGNVGQIPPEQVTTCNPSVRLEAVFNNKRFTVYKINK